MLRPLIFITLFLAFPCFGYSQTTWYVDDDNTTGPWDGSKQHPFQYIQDGIDASSNSDNVLVMAGTYEENISFNGKGITVKSNDGPGDTIIDGNRSGSVVLFTTKEGPDSVLDGFTITNGTGTYIHVAIQGGGICCYDESFPTIQNNIVFGNTVGSAGWGGGISCSHYSSPAILNNDISCNTSDLGGGIYCADYSVPYVFNNNITDNRASGLSGRGGGIYSTDSTDQQIIDNTITNNSAEAGGGIFCIYIVNQNISKNTISKNRAKNGHGGGIFWDGGINGTIVDNMIINNFAPQGGGVYLNQSSPIVSQNTIGGNTGHYGGGILCSYNSNPTIEKNDIRNNKVYTRGGGIYCEGYCSPKINENTISGNIVEYGDGGGIYCWYNSMPVITNNSIELNRSKSGGGIYSGSGATILDNKINGNASELHGGGIAIDGRITLKENAIGRNSAAFSGGGVCVVYGSGASILNNDIRENKAGTTGGGIHCESGTFLEIMHNTLIGNRAEQNGGGISCDYASYPEIINNIISKNKTGSTGLCHGGGIYCYESAPKIMNNTVVENESGNRGGGIYCWYSYASITNTIFWGNNAPLGKEIYISAGSPTITYCDVEGGWTGTGNVSEDPVFEDPINEDYHLDWRSPCINRGTDNGAPSDDIDGDGRPCMGTTDMGADEYKGTHSLAANTFVISEMGGQVDFILDAGVPNAGRSYMTLGSMSGTAPGSPLPGGQAILPLSWDLFTILVIDLMNSSVFNNFYGTLDSHGRAAAQLNTTAVPGLAGAKMYYAYSLFSPFDFTSNPVVIDVVF